jgi:hydrogenase-4 component F
MMIFGLLSVGVAAFLLIQVKDYKRLFAFSTIEHMGIILVAAGLGSYAAHVGALSQILAHTVTKSFCFFAAGAALLATGTRDISSVRGLIRTSPAAGIALMLGGLAIAGAPPFAIFLSEFSIIKAGIASGHYLVIGGLTLFIVIAFCGIMYHINRMVFGNASHASARTALPLSSKVTLIVAAIPVILLGLYIPHQIHMLLQHAAWYLGR